MPTVMNPLGDVPSDLESEASDMASTITILSFYTSKVLLNIECNSFTSSFPIFTKQPMSIHCGPPVIGVFPSYFIYSYEIVTF